MSGGEYNVACGGVIETYTWRENGRTVCSSCPTKFRVIGQGQERYPIASSDGKNSELMNVLYVKRV